MDEFAQRFAAAKSHRQEFIETAGREAYKFCFNGREAEWDRRVRKDAQPEEIFADAVADVAEEFYGEIFHTMTPENSPWVEYEAGIAVPEDRVTDVTEEIARFETAIDRALRASNYYDEGPVAFQDAVVGTVAMWVERPHLAAPIHCEAVPMPELYLRLGPMGIEDRFRCQRFFYRDLEAVFPNADWPREIRDKIKNSKNGSAKVVRGFWRDYSDPGNPEWVQQVRVDDKAIGLDAKLGEEGACPLIVGRFNAVPGSAWGRGPAIKSLPTLRVLNEVARMNLEAMDRQLDPAYVYPHDGMLDLSGGIEPGIGYPAMPGSGQQVQPLGIAGNLDYGFFSEERLTAAIRAAFYREIEQRGKTPPSASQYMGQEQKQVRRMARPAGKLWAEFGVGLLRRVEWIERQPGGGLEGQKFSMIEDNVVSARPVSPLERAQAREEVLIGQSIMEMAVQTLGEQVSILIDGPKTIQNIKAKLKDKLVEVRSEDQIRQAVQMMQEAQGAPQG